MASLGLWLDSREDRLLGMARSWPSGVLHGWPRVKKASAAPNKIGRTGLGRDQTPYCTYWYLSFLTDRRQRVICNSIVCDWISINKGTTQGSVSGPCLVNIFINDLQTDPESNSLLFKYADDSTLIIPVWEGGDSNTAIHVVNNFTEWCINNCMKCNFSRCKEMVFRKKGYNNVLDRVQNIPQHPELFILGVKYVSGKLQVLYSRQE